MNDKKEESTISHVYLYDHLKKHIDLGDFLEVEMGVDLIWREQNVTAACICPMPHHKDNKPSFCIKHVEEDSIWIYQCWGCGSKGTILDFCVDYYGFQDVSEAVDFLCEKYNFKDLKGIVVESLRSLKKKINLQKKLDCQNIVISNRCRNMLRNDYNGNKSFVAGVYRELNEALNIEDSDTVQAVDDRVFRKAEERQNV